MRQLLISTDELDMTAAAEVTIKYVNKHIGERHHTCNRDHRPDVRDAVAISLIVVEQQNVQHGARHV